ncbi:MAG: SGNH/GDSL hydrolase family protein [Candidatus Eisenbacteria bacterium]
MKRVLSAMAVGSGLLGVAVSPWFLRLRYGRLGPDIAVPLWLISGFLLLTGVVAWRARRRPLLLANFGLCVAALLLSILAAEAILRRFAPQIAESRDLSRFHPTLGWELIPGATARSVFPGEFNGVVRVSSQGLLDREYSLVCPSGMRRIVVLGDSFTAGLGVDASKNFTERLEDAWDGRAEVLNFGVNGYGPVQEFLALRDKALHYQPDLALVVVYVRNDFDDILGRYDWGFPRPLVEAADSTFRLTNVPIPRPAAIGLGPVTLLLSYRKLHLYRLISKRVNPHGALWADPPELQLCRISPSPEIRRAFDLTERVLVAMKQVCAASGTDLVVAIAPSIVQVYPDRYWNEVLADHGADASDFDLEEPDRRLCRIGTDHDIETIDLLPALREAGKEDPELYYRRNLHWTARGHAVVARALQERLERRILPPRTPDTSDVSRSPGDPLGETKAAAGSGEAPPTGEEPR